MANTTINKKIYHMFELMHRLAQGEELYAQNSILQEELFGQTGEASERKLRRYLEDIHTVYSKIVYTQKRPKEFAERKVTVYWVPDRKKDVSEVLRYFLENDSDLDWILQMMHEQDPSFFDEHGADAKATVERMLKRDEEVFVFSSRPFEIMETPLQKNVFDNLKKAVRQRKYHNITYVYDGRETLKDVKCLKLVFTQNNWYLAAEDAEGSFRWLRVAFIEKISDSFKNSWQKHILDKYASFFETMEGPLTRFGVKPRTAHLKASPKVARYFREGMKPFFRSQRFVAENEDNSVEFEVDYTQPLEILPFVKNWLPDVEILAPDDLAKGLADELRAALGRYGKFA